MSSAEATSHLIYIDALKLRSRVVYNGSERDSSEAIVRCSTSTAGGEERRDKDDRRHVDTPSCPTMPKRFRPILLPTTTAAINLDARRIQIHTRSWKHLWEY